MVSVAVGLQARGNVPFADRQDADANVPRRNADCEGENDRRLTTQVRCLQNALYSLDNVTC
jgi:hypothetical protein